MAKIIERTDRIVPAWLSAARHLDVQPGRNERNLILEISSPLALTSQDKDVISAVDSAIRTKDPELSVETVAGTIFPASLYKKYGRPAFYGQYLEIMSRAQKPHTWGTYAMRMMRHQAQKGTTPLNPLEKVVQKLSEARSGRKIKSAYELGVTDLVNDLTSTNGQGCELPIHNPNSDSGRPTNIPCLSHLSFKLIDGKLDLTAIYRSHHYAARALGNLIGLGRLLNFVATESRFECGVLTCVATHAHLDTDNWGGVSATKKLLKSLPADPVR